MKIIFNGDCFTVFLLKKDNVDNMTDYLKNLILKLRKKYKEDIFGFYKVDVYFNDKIGMIAHFFKEDELDFFRDIIDLKVTIFEKASVYFEFDDYFLVADRKVYFYDGKFYVDLNNISEDDFFTMIEFCRIVFGDELEMIKDKMNLVGMN